MQRRIIPRLDIKGPNLVKGIHLEGLRALGPPEYFSRHYYENGADELLYMDAVASLYGRNSLTDVVKRASSEIFIPLCVGGGIRSIEDIRVILRAGADKVSINTAALADPEFIRQAAHEFGSSTIVVSIDVAQRNGEYDCYVDNGREPTNTSPFKWAEKAVELGAGELLVTSITNEGTGRGFDIELIRRISDSVPVPVIASGGAGEAAHVKEVIANGHADAVCIASLLHFDVLDKVHVPKPGEYGIGQRAYESSMSHVQGMEIRELKHFLTEQEIPTRPFADA